MANYRTNGTLEQENWSLRQKVKNLTARNTLLTSERDAARTALNNANLKVALAEYHLKDALVEYADMLKNRGVT